MPTSSGTRCSVRKAAFSCKSENLPGTPNQELNLLRPASAPDPHNPLERALQRLGAGIEERLLLNGSGGQVPATKPLASVLGPSGIRGG